MDDELTEKQAAILDKIKSFMAENGYAPSVKELAKHFERRDNTIFEQLMRIEKKGYIRKVPSVARGIIVLK